MATDSPHNGLSPSSILTMLGARRFDSYGVFVPVMFQEQFVVIIEMNAYTIPRVVYYRMIDD
ncbi:MAG: hypothetical protein GX762_03115 [Bacteroidales bacterium]|nr:hypothetical protein [Bacteroidales bacterium]